MRRPVGRHQSANMPDASDGPDCVVGRDDGRLRREIAKFRVTRKRGTGGGRRPYEEKQLG